MDHIAPTPVLLPRAWYRARVVEFCTASATSVLGELTANSHLDVTPEQRDAWLEEIAVLQQALPGMAGTLLLEFSIPRMGHRADAVLLLDKVLIVLEFKTTQAPTRADRDQVCEYALELKKFHRASHEVAIVPVLAHAGPATGKQPELVAAPDQVYLPIDASFADLAAVLRAIVGGVRGPGLEPGWEQEPYQPTPDIIIAARALFAGHRVEAIAQSEAGGDDLRRTSSRLLEIVTQTCAAQRRAICFVTGVPGAGKTLVGLGLATQPEASHNAVYLSGNGPLVAVLKEALARDCASRRTRREQKAEDRDRIKKFIQNVHHFRDDGLGTTAPPHEQVVIFDEAQRAWNEAKLSNFMQRRKRRPDFHHSEPEVLLQYMNRRPDWAVVIALVGGGQEINTGEAGIAIWLQQLNKRFRDWDIFLPSQLAGHEFGAQGEIEALARREGVTLDPCLHLATSVRSFRASNLSIFVQALLDHDRSLAREQWARLGNYPIVLTRNLEAAKDWVRRKARARERYGLLASSRALRLKPHAVDVRVKTDPVHWFLDDRDDVRSSFYLEDPATEFDVQGLELEWACVTWDGDLRHQQDGWSYHDFHGNRWKSVHKQDRRAYIRNAYRVLLTRARQGMAIFVPPGSSDDPTRPPEYYDATFRYLADLGLPQLP